MKGEIVRTFRILVLSLIIMALLAAVGCGEEKKTTTTETRTETPATSEPAKPTETTTPAKTVTYTKDCSGYDLNNVPRYPNCTRTSFESREGDLAEIIYVTLDNVQTVANHCLANISGIKIVSSSETDARMQTSSNNATTTINITAVAGEFSITGQKETKIEIKCYSSDDSSVLKSDDPTMHVESYNTVPNSSAVSLVKSMTDVAGEDSPIPRPSNQYTVRTWYAGASMPSGPGTYINNTYLTASPFGPTVIEYLNRGYKVIKARREYDLKGTLVGQYATLKTSDKHSSELGVSQDSKDSGATAVAFCWYSNP